MVRGCDPAFPFSTISIGGDFLGFASWSMVGDALVNYAESAALFTAVAAALDKALEKKWVRPFVVDSEP